jgi:hypothetical protein
MSNTMTEDTCGHPTAAGGECQHPTTDDGNPNRCWEDSHNESKTESGNAGRPNLLDDERKQEIIYTAVSSGLSIRDQAALAQVDPDTLRRGLCCIESPSHPAITADEPCEFCGGYVRARAQGAMEVLQECRPEFRASATFGYVKTEKQELTGEDGDDISVTSDVVTVTSDE